MFTCCRVRYKLPSHAVAFIKLSLVCMYNNGKDNIWTLALHLCRQGVVARRRMSSSKACQQSCIDGVFAFSLSVYTWPGLLCGIECHTVFLLTLLRHRHLLQ